MDALRHLQPGLYGAGVQRLLQPERQPTGADRSGDGRRVHEAGSKYRTADGVFTLNTALFYAKYHNFQANSFVNLNGSVITQLTNAGDVSTRGVEIDRSLHPVRNFTLTGGLAFTDAHIDRFNLPPGAPAGSSTRQGERLPLAPKWKGNLGATWKIETGGFADIELGSQVSLTSDQVSSLEPNRTR